MAWIAVSLLFNAVLLACGVPTPTQCTWGGHSHDILSLQCETQLQARMMDVAPSSLTDAVGTVPATWHAPKSTSLTRGHRDTAPDQARWAVCTWCATQAHQLLLFEPRNELTPHELDSTRRPSDQVKTPTLEPIMSDRWLSHFRNASLASLNATVQRVPFRGGDCDTVFERPVYIVPMFAAPGDLLANVLDPLYQMVCCWWCGTAAVRQVIIVVCVDVVRVHTKRTARAI